LEKAKTLFVFFEINELRKLAWLREEELGKSKPACMLNGEDNALRSLSHEDLRLVGLPPPLDMMPLVEILIVDPRRLNPLDSVDTI